MNNQQHNSGEDIHLEFQDFNNQPVDFIAVDDQHAGGIDGNLSIDNTNMLMDEPFDVTSDSPILQSSASPTATTSTVITSTNNAASNAPFWSIEYYQSYFNITTKEVSTRIIKTFGFPAKNNFLAHIKENGGADIWAPFWIITTLIVLLVISSNMGGFFNWQQAFYDLSKQSQSSHNGTAVIDDPVLKRSLEQWASDFSIISMGAITCYSFLILVPLILYSAMRWKKIESISLAELLCLYGYSFVIILPSAILCVINLEWFRWIMLLGSASYSAAFLLFNLLQIWKEGLFNASNNGGFGNKSSPDAGMFMIIFSAYIIILHLGFAIFIKFYFFNYHLIIKWLK